MSTYRVIYERDTNGWWMVTVRGVRGCHSHGSTIEKAREHICEALALCVGEAKAAAAEFTEEVRLSTEEKKALRSCRQARRKAEELNVEAAALTASTARLLSQRLSVRDVGELLGISHQRVQQIVSQAHR